MKLNHLSQAVQDVAVTAAFMEDIFGFTVKENKGNVIVAMKGSDGFVLVLTTAKAAESPYPADFYLGFFLDSEKEVMALHEKITKAGHEISRPPAKIRNSFGFYFYIPGNIMAEVSSSL
jgi:catechol 2,3-dioxygenase-like lactoylglutathione lyase family enzyme